MSGHNNPPPFERQIVIGKIVKVRGLKGELKIYPLTWRPERFKNLKGVWYRSESEDLEYLIIINVRIASNSLHLFFHGYSSRELAEKLVGGELIIDETEREALPDDSYYLDDLLGCLVECKRYGNLGEIVNVDTNTAQDIWQINGQYGEVLIPAVKQFIISIDTDKKLIQVDSPEGLVEIIK